MLTCSGGRLHDRSGDHALKYVLARIEGVEAPRGVEVEAGALPILAAVGDAEVASCRS